MDLIRSPIRILVTLTTVVFAIILAWLAWHYYMVSPWTRDGRVRVEVVTVAPEVSGRIVDLKVNDNQFVKKGDILFVIDPDRFKLALDHAQASVEAAKATMEVAKGKAQRRRNLDNLSVSEEEKQISQGEEDSATSNYMLAQADARVAALDLEKTVVRSPVNGYVTNLRLRNGSYASTGVNAITIVDSDSFWVAGYFEETKLKNIRNGDKAVIRLMGEDRELTGRVNSISRGIADKNGEADTQGLANVDPTFTWVRLAQRIPVRIELDNVPENIMLSAGQTCTVIITR
ncbi:efflux RND transporter periplasmic adaptor subunit [Microvirga sp. W0021]|uniref:Efflux RND transporter periplasmic adaptor subunit n=1 Tax=Hohaiivirga grylli TaxID=3133970 RepID=A0ABV0BG24_9HYPH